MYRIKPSHAVRLLTMKGNLTAQDILYNATVHFQLFLESPLLFQHDSTLVHKTRSIKRWLDELDVEKHNWPKQSPHFNFNIKHLWDEQEQGKPVLPDLTNAALEEKAKKSFIWVQIHMFVHA